MLSRDDILTLTEKPIGTITIPEWSGEIGLRALSAQELVDMREAIEGEDGDQSAILNRFCKTAAVLISDADGKRLFSDADAIGLRTRGLAILTRIITEGKRLNGIGEDAVRATEKNSESGPT